MNFLFALPTSRARPRAPWWVRVFNVIARRLLAAGMPMGPNGLISVRGRKTGVLHTTPVTIIEGAEACWVLGVFGDVDWVRNLRAAGRATLTQRRGLCAVESVELSQEESVTFFRDVFAPLVRRYGGLGAWIVRHLDKIDINDPVEAARGRPVFKLRPVAQPTPR